MKQPRSIKSHGFKKRIQYRWMPLFLGIVTTVLIIGLWQLLLVQERARIEQSTQQEANTIEVELDRELSTRILALQRMASRWQSSGGTPQMLWEADSANYIKDSYGYRAIESIDSSLQVRWVVPPQEDGAAQRMSFIPDPHQQFILKVARDLPQTRLFHTVSLAQGAEEFFVAVPLFLRAQNQNQANQSQADRFDEFIFDGFIVGVMRFQPFFDSILHASPWYQVQIDNRSGLIYSQDNPSVDVQPRTSIVQAYDVDWEVQVFPTPAGIAVGRSSLPSIVLGGGVAGAGAIALIVYLGQRANRQARRTQMVNRQLQDEIIYRQQIEASLRTSEERFRVLVTHSPVGIFQTDAQGQCLYVNPRWSQLTGLSATEALGDGWAQALHPADRSAIYTEWKEATQEGRLFSLEYRFQKPDSTVTWVAGRAIAVRNEAGEITRYFGTVMDITDRKQAEGNLQQAMAAAEAANLAKSMFLANMSHELRTPLNVILGFAQVMARDPSLTASQQEDLHTIRCSGDHLLSLINDILDLSKIEAGHSTLEETEFNLIALLQTLQTMMTERARVKQLQLRFEIAPDVPQLIVADEQKLRQVLLNLLSNAIKFTRQGSVTLQVTSQKPFETACLSRCTSPTESQSDNGIPVYLHKLEFKIIDTGVGITAADQAVIFDAFVQSEAGKKSLSGTGLGLTISRKLLELMGGTIAVESLSAIGSTFTATVPVCLINEIKTLPQPENHIIVGLIPGQADRRILVVDDQRENRMLMVRLLTQLGLQVREATNGQEAIQIWQEWQPDLTWMDVRMPELDGYEATRRIRSLEAEQRRGTHASTVVIALTAQASPPDRALALAAGCNDYISKPFEEETVFLKMAEYLGLKYRYAQSSELFNRPSTKLSSFAPDPFNQLSLMMFTDLSPDWIQNLENWAISGNDRSIVQFAAQLPSELAPLSQSLTYLANQFEFEQILRWLRNPIQKGDYDDTP